VVLVRRTSKELINKLCKCRKKILAKGGTLGTYSKHKRNFD
jgi:hypothetical protein